MDSRGRLSLRSVPRLNLNAPQRISLAVREIYSLWRMPLRVYCATHFTHLAVSRHGAIRASVLVSKLPDTLSLDYHSRREYHF